MTTRLLYWMAFDCFASLLPLIFAFLMRFVLGASFWEALVGSPEFLFLALMASATTGRDLLEFSSTIGLDDFFRVASLGLGLGVILAVFLYAFFLQVEAGAPSSQDSKERLFFASLVLAMITFSLSALVQWRIGRLERT